MDRDQLAQKTEELLARYFRDRSEYGGVSGSEAKRYASEMAQLLAPWLEGWRNPPRPPGRHRSEARHTAGGGCWCGIPHSVIGAQELNADPEAAAAYTQMIRRSDNGPDPLVQEPKS